MPRLSFKSVNSALAAIISIVLLTGVSILVIYVGKSSYNIVNETSVDGMKIINRGLIANVNDLIDANMSMVKVPAQSGQAKLKDMAEGSERPFALENAAGALAEALAARDKGEE